MNHLQLPPTAFVALDRCARLFRYVYLDQLVWPGTESQPVAADQHRHAQFSRLVALAARGRRLDTRLPALEAEVRTWWALFLESAYAQPVGTVYADYPLQVLRQNAFVVATPQRLIVAPGRIHLLEWRTDCERPCNQALGADWRTRLLPLITCLAASRLMGGTAILPEQVRLTLWFVRHPQAPFHLTYSQAQFTRDLEDLDERLQQLASANNNFAMTENLDTCNSCLFRVRCFGIAAQSPDPEPLRLLEQPVPILE